MPMRSTAVAHVMIRYVGCDYHVVGEIMYRFVNVSVVSNRCWMLDAGWSGAEIPIHRGCWMLDAGYWILDAGWSGAEIPIHRGYLILDKQ